MQTKTAFVTKVFSLTLAGFISATAIAAPTEDLPAQHVDKVNVTYSRLITPMDLHGASLDQAIIGGNVEYVGRAPAYVTIKIAGQVYTQPTDFDGNFSFLVFTNRAPTFNISAWLPSDHDAATPPASRDVEKTFSIAP